MAELGKHGLEAKDLKIQVEGDMVKVDGSAVDQATKEKIVLALGNVDGIAKVEDNLTAAAGQAANFCTVTAGDTLSKIAKKQYGDANKYQAIFEANKPMLSHPDKIYPGQVLRIPAL